MPSSAAHGVTDYARVDKLGLQHNPANLGGKERGLANPLTREASADAEKLENPKP